MYGNFNTSGDSVVAKTMRDINNNRRRARKKKKKEKARTFVLALRSSVLLAQTRPTMESSNNAH